MNRSSPYPGLAAALLLGCLAVGFLILRQRAAIVRVHLELGATDKAAQARLADLRRQLAAVQAAQLRAEKETAQLSQAAAASPAAASDGAVRTIHYSEIVKDHPEYAAILAKQARRNMIRQYGAGLDSLNLPPDQLAKLKDLLVERSLSTQDALQAARSAGLAQGTPAWSEALKAATAPVEKEMSALLGTESGPVLRKLQTQAGAVSQIRYNYAPDLDEAGVALTAEQTNGLQQALARSWNNDSIPPAARADYGKVDPATGLSPADNRMLEAAAQALSTTQLQVLRTSQIRENQQNAIFRQYLTGITRGYRIMP